MASLFNRVISLARSPQGRKVIDQASRKAQELARDPKNRARIEDARRRLQRRREP